MLTEREIVVLTGVHAGARLPISSSATIGRAEECSIVLSGDDLAPVHLLLAPSGRGIAVTPLATVRATADKTAWTQGTSRLIERDAVLELGDTRLLIRLSDTSPSVNPDTDEGGAARQKARHRPARSRHRLVLPVLAAATVTVGAVIAALSFLGEAPAPRAQASTVAAVAPLRIPTTRSFLLFATATAAAAGLPSISFAEGSDGTVVATGLITPADSGRWQWVRSAIDARFDGQVVLLDQVSSDADMPDLKVSAVWLGSDPYVMTDDGAQFHRGAILSGGWFLDGIARGSLQLRRGDRSVRLRY